VGDELNTLFKVSSLPSQISGNRSGKQVSAGQRSAESTVQHQSQLSDEISLVIREHGSCPPKLRVITVVVQIGILNLDKPHPTIPAGNIPNVPQRTLKGPIVRPVGAQQRGQPDETHLREPVVVNHVAQENTSPEINPSQPESSDGVGDHLGWVMHDHYIAICSVTVDGHYRSNDSAPRRGLGRQDREIVHHPATVFTVSYGLVWTVTKPLNQRVVAAVAHAAQKVLDADDARPLVNSKKMRIS
jgi:hypothetical protein